jgi:hypothetical protein
LASISSTHAASLARKLGVGALGLALGLGAALAVRAHGQGGGQPASVQRLTLPGSDAAAAPAQLGPTAPVAAGSAREAVQRFFTALARGDLVTSYGLLDRASRAAGRYDSLARWTDALGQRAPVSGVTVGGERRVTGDTTDVTVELRHPASIDPYAGLVPGRTLEVWRAHKEAGGWRVAADPVAAQALLPSDRLAPAAVNAWVGKLAGCDRRGATAQQVEADLYGQASLAQIPCKLHGRWTAGAPQPFSAVRDPTAYVAAFGAEVGSWARLVPVQGPGGSRFAAVVGPLGDAWRVIGVDPGQG